MRLLRFERRFVDVKWSDVQHQILRNNALGMDELLMHIAPHAHLGDCDPRNSYVRPHCVLALAPCGPAAAPNLPVRARATRPSPQVYSCDPEELVCALDHLLQNLGNLARGDNTDPVPFWSSRVWRDLLAAFMLVPVPRLTWLKPTHPQLFDVENSQDECRMVHIAMYHRQLWYGKNTLDAWRLAVLHYNSPELLLHDTLHGPASRAPDGGAAQRFADAQTQRSSAMRVRHALARQQVRALICGQVGGPWPRRTCRQANEAELSLLQPEALRDWIALNVLLTRHPLNARVRYYNLARGRRHGAARQPPADRVSHLHLLR
jgi:hypothetical protein